MKKHLVLTLALSCLVASTASYAVNYGMAGCGVGALALADQPGKIQILAATLNNIISPQTSAITSGTSNCYEDSAREEASLFITVNQEALRKDIARGDGETLTGLSRIYGCSDSRELGTSLQKNFNQIFPSEKSSGAEVSKSIESSIEQDHSLAKTCRIFG